MNVLLVAMATSAI